MRSVERTSTIHELRGVDGQLPSYIYTPCHEQLAIFHGRLSVKSFAISHCILAIQPKKKNYYVLGVGA